VPCQPEALRLPNQGRPSVPRRRREARPGPDLRPAASQPEFRQQAALLMHLAAPAVSGHRERAERQASERRRRRLAVLATQRAALVPSGHRRRAESLRRRAPASVIPSGLEPSVRAPVLECPELAFLSAQASGAARVLRVWSELQAPASAAVRRAPEAPRARLVSALRASSAAPGEAVAVASERAPWAQPAPAAVPEAVGLASAYVSAVPPQAAPAASVRQAAVAAAEVPDGSAALEAVAASDVPVRALAAVVSGRAEAAAEQRLAAARSDAAARRGPAVPSVAPWAAASVFRQGRLRLAAGPARSRWARFVHAMRSLGIASW